MEECDQEKFQIEWKNGTDMTYVGINALDECVQGNNKIAIVIQNEMLLHFYVYKKI